MYTAVSQESYGRSAFAAIGLLVVAASLLLLAAGLPARGIAAASILLVPLGIYLALVKPLTFPFGLYVLLVPFDNLLAAGSFGTLTKLLGILSGAFLILWLARRRTIAPAPDALLPLGLLLLWMIASMAWAINQQDAIEIIPTYAGLFALYAALALTPLSMKEFEGILACVVMAGLAAAAYGANVFYHNPALAANAQNSRLVIQLGSDFIDPNHFANSLLFPAAALAVWALRTPRIVAKVAGISGEALIVTAILLSGSREALIAFAAIWLYLLWRLRYRLQMIIASLAGFAVVGSVHTSMWQRFATAIDTGGSGRTSIWAVALEAAKHQLIQGYGIGNFESAYDNFYLSVQQIYPFGWSSAAHNIVFHYLVELGVIGLVLLGWFFYRQFRSIASIDRSSEVYDYRVLLEAALIGIVIVSFTVDLFTYKYAWLVLFAVVLFRSAALQSRLIQR